MHRRELVKTSDTLRDKHNAQVVTRDGKFFAECPCGFATSAWDTERQAMQDAAIHDARARTGYGSLDSAEATFSVDEIEDVLTTCEAHPTWDYVGVHRYAAKLLREKDAEIKHLQADNKRLMRCCGKDEMRTEIERLNALVTKGRTLNDLERLMEENERLRKALDEIETLAANDTCGCNKMAPIIAICQMENKA